MDFLIGFTILLGACIAVDFVSKEFPRWEERRHARWHEKQDALARRERIIAQHNAHLAIKQASMPRF